MVLVKTKNQYFNQLYHLHLHVIDFINIEVPQQAQNQTELIRYK